MSWTDERIEELTRLWQAGMSASEIGKQLGVSKNAVVGKAHRLKLPSRPSPIKQSDKGAAQKPASTAETATSASASASTSTAAAASTPARSAPSQQSSAEAARPRRKPAVQKARNGTTARLNGTSIRAQVEARGGGGTGCLWPIGDPNDPDFHFCGAAPAPGKPYCAEHAARAYITKSRSDREERDEEAA